MRVELEPFVPYHEGLQWRISHAYYAQRGVDAWLGGDLPYRATSSAPFARQHAVFFDRVAPVEGPLDVLEVGAGLGRFAAAFLTELDLVAPARSAQVRFVVSDLVADNVRAAVARPPLAAFAGRIVPAVLDPATGALSSLDGAPLSVRCAMIVANYVCDSTPVRLFRKDGDAFFEKWTRLVAEVPEGTVIDPLANALEPIGDLTAESEWRPVDLDARLPPEHADAVRALAAPYARATLPWFEPFLDLVTGLRRHLVPAGVIVVSDYGSCRADEMIRNPVVPVRYANALCHPVNFAMFDAWAPRVGLGATRTNVSTASLHTVALGERDVAAAFDEAFVRNAWGEDLLDFNNAARTFTAAGRHLEAIRMLRRALALDPRSVGLHHRLGEACVEANRPEEALEILLAGHALPRHPQWDFEFVIGRAYFHMGLKREALGWFRTSSDRQDHAATRLNLALAYRDLGEFDAAYAECQHSVRLDPEYERARTLLTELGERVRG